MNWFRFYTESLDNPKIQKLSPDLFKNWVNLLCLARLHDGVLPPFGDIAFRLRCSEKQARAHVNALVEKRLIDRDGDKFTPHDWQEYQYPSDTSAERTRQYRERKKTSPRDGPPENEPSPKRGSDADVTSQAPSQERFSDVLEQNRTEQSRTDTHNARARNPRNPVAADLNGQTSQRFEEFWKQYPRQQRKDAACMEWVSRVAVETESAVFACLKRYLASDEVARGVVMNPDKWLYEQGRQGWDGTWQPSKVESIRKPNASAYVPPDPSLVAGTPEWKAREAREIEAERKARERLKPAN